MGKFRFFVLVSKKSYEELHLMLSLLQVIFPFSMLNKLRNFFIKSTPIISALECYSGNSENIQSSQASVLKIPNSNQVLAILVSGKNKSKYEEHVIHILIHDLQELVLEMPLVEAIKMVNLRIYDLVRNAKSSFGLGLSLTACLISPTEIEFAQVGDTRAAIVHGSTLYFLTEEHTLVSSLVNAGTISQEEVDSYSNSNILNRAIGSKENVEVDSQSYKNLFQKDTRILLCTNEVTSRLTSREIAYAVSENETPIAAKYLIQKAIQRGASSNLSVVLLAKKSSQKYYNKE